MKTQAEVNRFVIDYLREGPAETEVLYSDAFKWGRVPRGMVNCALMHFRVRPKRRVPDGASFMVLPDNLSAIWWARPCMARFAGGGHAA